MSVVLKFGVDAKWWIKCNVAPSSRTAPRRKEKSRLDRRNDALRAILKSKGFNSIFDVGAQRKRQGKGKGVVKSPRERYDDLFYEKCLIELSERWIT